MKIRRVRSGVTASAGSGFAKAAISRSTYRSCAAGAVAAGLVGGGVGGERLVVGAGRIERLAEAEAQVGPVRRGVAGTGEGLAQPDDQRIVGPGDRPQSGQPGQGQGLHRIERQGLLVGVAGRGAMAALLVQAAEVDPGRNEAGIEIERRIHLARRIVASRQRLGKDDGAVEVRFLRLLDAAGERLVVRRQGFLPAALVLPLPGQVEPLLRAQLTHGDGSIGKTALPQSQAASGSLPSWRRTAR